MMPTKDGGPAYNSALSRSPFPDGATALENFVTRPRCPTYSMERIGTNAVLRYLLLRWIVGQAIAQLETVRTSNIPQFHRKHFCNSNGTFLKTRL